MSDLNVTHNSFEEFYRSPPGAVSRNTDITIRIEVITDNIPEKVILCLKNEENILKKLEMRTFQKKKNRIYYETTFNLDKEIPIVWYYFNIVTGDGGYFYGKKDHGYGGEGELKKELNKPYQITLYDPGFSTPDWFKNSIVYQIFVDRFNNGNKDNKILNPKKNSLIHSHWDNDPLYIRDEKGDIARWDFFGGNLQGVRKKLPYLKKLGINVIYFNPVFKAVSNHKYDVGDYHKIDEMFGDNELFEKLVAEARNLGIYVILDGVFSHTGSDSIYFNKYNNYNSVGAYQSPESRYYDWYKFEEYCDEYECWWGEKGLPEVDELNPSFQDFIIFNKNSVLKFWMNKGIKGWRLDVVDELPDEFLKKFRTELKKCESEAVLLGEVWEDASSKISYGERREYLGGKELDSVTNYPFRNILLDYFRGEKDAELVHLALNTLFENYPLPHFYSTMNLLGSHDVKRILTELIPDEIPDDVKSDKKNIGFKRLKQLILWQMTFPGVPSIYYGDEAGLEGEEDPDNRRTYPWGKENQDLIRWYKEKIYLRNNYDMFRTGEWISLKFDNNIYGYLRKIENNSDVFSEEKENNTALVLFNPDINNSRQISLDLSKWFHNTVFDFLENKKINIKSGAENKLTLPPLTGKVVLDKKWPEKILNQRKAGILLHISSLPSDYGIGDLGKNAYKFIDFLEKSQQTYWQILPFTPPAKENSPYRSFSAFAGNPLLIDPEFLVKKGWLKPAELEENFQFNHHNVDFSLVKKYKHKILKKAFSRFNKRKNNEKFNRFIKENRYWLEDYSLFMALYGHFGGKNWTKWPDEIANYNKKAVEKYETLLKEEINFHNFLQYIFFEQWTELKKYAHKKGIKIIGDIPIFVDHNSSEVWANPHLFKLNSEGKPEKVAGVPPDAFSETGQKWGNPVYDWNNMAQEKFQWWLNRFAWMEKLVDEVRLDHFRGFEAYWEIPAESETAINGEWKRAPGKEFFDTVKSKLKKLSIIAEDLGYITPEVEELKIINDFPGMKILQFMISPEIDQDLSLPYHQYKNYVYTGTHDNKTLWQWYQDYQKNESESSFKKFEYFNLTRKDVCWNFIEKVFSSPALKAIIPLQDFLGLGKEGRMNTPGTSRDNWDWRFSWKMIPENMSSELKQLTEKHERN